MLNNSIYLIYKSIGPSSFACVNQLRHSLGAEKAGHIGTLDPFAEGLLPVFVNRATRLIPYLEVASKTYRALVVLGAKSTSLDANGELVSKQELSFQTYYALLKDDAALAKAQIQQLVGVSEQEIPLYSAKKVNGKKLYEYARQNQSVEKQYKTIEVTAAKLLNFQGIISQTELAELDLAKLEQLYTERLNELKQQKAWPNPTLFPAAKARLQMKKLAKPLEQAAISAWCKFTPTLYFDIEFTVSKGTFIRALVADLGKRLGTEAYTLRLLRTKVGQFDLADAHSESEWQDLFAQTKSETERAKLGLNLQTAFSNLPNYVCNDKEHKWLLQGRTLSFYQKELAKKPEYSTEHLWKNLINLPAMSIIKQRQYVLAIYEGQVIALLSLREMEQGLQLVPERMLFSHEDL